MVRAPWAGRADRVQPCSLGCIELTCPPSPFHLEHSSASPTSALVPIGGHSVDCPSSGACVAATVSSRWHAGFTGATTADAYLVTHLVSHLVQGAPPISLHVVFS